LSFANCVHFADVLREITRGEIAARISLVLVEVFREFGELLAIVIIRLDPTDGVIVLVECGALKNDDSKRERISEVGRNWLVRAARIARKAKRETVTIATAR
jgi:hypothetical protein